MQIFCSWNISDYYYHCWNSDVFLRICYERKVQKKSYFFAFITTGQYLDRKWSGGERGAGSGKVRELELDLRTTEAQQHYTLGLLAPT